VKSLLIEVERFLRWLRDCTPEERQKNDSKIGEMSMILVDQLEPLIDKLEHEDDLDDSD
jgi:hypothetical protein